MKHQRLVPASQARPPEPLPISPSPCRELRLISERLRESSMGFKETLARISSPSSSDALQTSVTALTMLAAR